jgi:hypothetical protein
VKFVWETFLVAYPAILTFVAGIGIVAFGFWCLYAEIRARWWSTCQGIVTRSETEKSTFYDRGVKEALYAPLIEYEYVVNGMIHRSKFRSFSNWSLGDRLSALEILSKYKLGAQVTVRFDPRNPARAALEYGIGPGSIFCLCLGAFLILLAIFDR